MIKRASTILLTLFLLLLGFNTAFAAPSCSTTFSKTNFAPKTTGATYYELNEVLFSEGISTEMSAALNFVKDTNPARGKYTVSGNKLSLGCVKNGSLMSITIPNLKSGKTYSISITGSVRLRAKESDASEKHRTKFKLAVGNSDKYFENSGSDWTATGPCNMSLEFTATSSTATALLTTDYSGDCYILDITEIKVVGCYDPQIVSSAGDLIPKGNPCTFSAIGLTGSITWKYIDEAGVTHPLSGNGNSVTIDNIVSGGEIVATGGGTSLSYKFLAIISCSEHADKLDVVNITFKMPGSSPCRLDQITDNDVTSGNIRLSSEYCYGYFDPLCKCDPNNRNPKQESLPSGKGPTEEHYVIAKSTQGMFPGWTQNEVVNSATNDGSGFMIVNCGQQIFNQEEVERGQLDRGKICEFTIRNLCPDTWYDFSAQVRDIDQNPNDLLPTNVRFVAIGANNEILLNYPTGSIPESWVPKGQSFNTKTNSIVKLILYNNQEPNTTSCDIPGSDLGLDNIKFTRCIPKLGTFSNQGRTEQGGEICNNRNDVNVTLYSGHSQFGITDMINSPYYIFLKSKNGGKWEIVNSTPINDVNNGYAELTDIIASDANDAGSKYQYTSVVAGHTAIAQDMANYLTSKTPSTYESDRKNYKYTGTGTIHCYENLYAFSEKLTTYTVVCANPCTEPVAPKLTNTLVEVCPGGTYDLNSVFPASNRDSKLTYQWYADNEVDKLPSSSVSIANPGETVYKIRSEEDKVANICPSKFSAVTVKVLTNPVIQLQIMNDEGELVDYKDKTYSICKGDEVTIQTNVDASLDLSWSTDPTDATVNALKAPYITVSPQVKTKYTASVLGGSCYQPSSMYIEVITVEKPTIKTDDDNVCKGSEINITSNYSDNTVTATAQYEYKWYRTQDKTNWGEPYKTGVNSLEQLTVNEVGTWYYKLVVSVGGCSEESDPLEIKVGEAVEFTVSATDYALCLEGNTYINIDGLDQTDPDLGTFQWFEGDTPVGAEDEASVNVTPTTTGTKTYTAVVKTVSGCQSKKSLDITVDSKVNLTVSPDQDICVKELSEPITASGADSYEWTPNLGTNGRVSHEEPGEKKYTVKAIAGECDATAVVTINVHELPEISSITPKSEEETNDMVITMDYSKGQSPFEFSLDGVDFIEVQSGIWENAPIGWNVLYVKDEYECINFKEFYVEPTPISPDKFFSPNGDNNRDEWKVRNLESYDSYIVEIFTRHGKRLYIKRVGSFNTDGSNVDGSEFTGWNGEYNGKPMPSDDYWYLITVEDIRKQYTGHFTLKR